MSKRGELIPDILAGLARGETLAQIGKRHGMSAPNVFSALKCRGLPTCARDYQKRERRRVWLEGFPPTTSAK